MRAMHRSRAKGVVFSLSLRVSNGWVPHPQVSTTKLALQQQKTPALLQPITGKEFEMPGSDFGTVLCVDKSLSSPSGINLVGNYFGTDRIVDGTGTHAYNALLGVIILILFSLRRAPSNLGPALSHAIMTGSFCGLVVDNLINASGKYVGEGSILRRLTQLRLILHGWSTPSLFVPVIQTAKHFALFPSRSSHIAMGAAVAYAFYEVMEWLLLYDINDLLIVDRRNLKTHSPRAMAGTLTYTSGKVLKCVLPVVLLQLFTLAVGFVLWARGAAGGRCFLASGVISILSCSLQQPNIQAYGETAMLSLMWAGSASAH